MKRTQYMPQRAGTDRKMSTERWDEPVRMTHVTLISLFISEQECVGVCMCMLACFWLYGIGIEGGEGEKKRLCLCKDAHAWMYIL